MSTLAYSIEIKLNYTKNFSFTIRKTNDENIKIEKINYHNRKITKRITPKTLFKDLDNLSGRFSLMSANLICHFEHHSFYEIWIPLKISKIENCAIEDIITNIEKSAKNIPVETTYPVYIENIDTKINFNQEELEFSECEKNEVKICSRIEIKKRNRNIDLIGPEIGYNNQSVFIKNKKEKEFSLSDEDNIKKHLNAVFENIIINSDDPDITEHERITMIAELRKRSRHDIVELMKTRYHYHIKFYTECQKILRNTQ